MHTLTHPRYDAGSERESAGKRAGSRVCPRTAIDEHWVQWLPAMHAAFIGATAERARASASNSWWAGCLGAHLCAAAALSLSRTPAATAAGAASCPDIGVTLPTYRHIAAQRMNPVWTTVMCHIISTKCRYCMAHCCHTTLLLCQCDRVNITYRQWYRLR